MLDKSTEKVGRLVNGTLCTKAKVNIFDEEELEKARSAAILQAFRKLVDEYIVTYSSEPNVCQITSGDRTKLVEAFNKEMNEIYETIKQQYVDGAIPELPMSPKHVDRWSDAPVVDGIKLRTGCSIKDGVITLQCME